MGPQAYRLAFEVRDAYLYVRAVGVRNRDTVAAIPEQVFGALDLHGLTKVLVDVRDLAGRLGVINSYLVATEVFSNCRGRGLAKAAVVAERAESPTG